MSHHTAHYSGQRQAQYSDQQSPSNSSSESSFYQQQRPMSSVVNSHQYSGTQNKKLYQNSESSQESENSGSSDQSYDESSLNSNSPRFNQGNKNANKLSALKQESEEDEDESIDYIEERIRKLERDLEDRLDKHKNKQSAQKPSQLKKQKEKFQNAAGKIIPCKKGSLQQHRQPPRPHTSVGSSSHPQESLKASYREQKQNILSSENKGHFEVKRQQTLAPQQSKGLEKGRQEQKEQIQRSKISLEHSKRTDPKNVDIHSSGSRKAQQKAIMPSNSIPEELKRLNKEISSLKFQNKGLKDQLSLVKKKFPKKYQHQKCATLEEISRFNEISAVDMRKLEKQFELLKVLQKLQSKLKHSIDKKLGKGVSGGNKAKKHAALMHKGLPSNILS